MTDFLQALVKNAEGVLSEEAKRRADICADCPLKEKKLYARILNATMEEIDGYVCNECGCPIATKIFAKEKENICPKWRQ